MVITTAAADNPADKTGVFLRAVTLPVECPVDETWDNFRDALHAAWRVSTDLANWSVHHLFRHDAPNQPKTQASKVYLYGDAAKQFPDWQTRCAGIASSAQCIFRAVQKKYLQDRFDIQVKHDSALLTYRYPFPFPVHNAVWDAHFAKGNWPGEAPIVEFPLPVLGRVKLRLKRGPEFGRQLAQLRQLIDGTAKRGEAAIYQDRKGNVLVKLVGHFPRYDRGDTPNVAFVHTDPGALLVVEINGRRANITNADHIKREIAKHKTMLQRTREDKKRELRMDRRQRANLNKHVKTRCEKQNDRLDTYVKQVARQVANMCQRQRVGTVCYDDAIKEFMRDGFFPWHALKTRISQLVVGEMGCDWIDGQFAHITDSKERDEWYQRKRAKAGYQTVRKIARHKSRPAKKSHSAVSRRPRITSECPAR